MMQQVRVIKTQHEYDAAIARLSTLKNNSIDSSDNTDLELLTLVIESYERNKIPKDPVDAILFRMNQEKLNAKDLVPLIGSISKVSEVLSRKRPLSLAMIRAICKGLNIPAEILISTSGKSSTNLLTEQKFNYSKFPVLELLKRGYFPNFNGSSKTAKDNAEVLVRQFLVGVPDDYIYSSRLRAPLHQSGSREMDEYSLIAWHLCVLKKACNLKFRVKYTNGVITETWLRDLAKLSRYDCAPLLASEYLADQGIALVIEPRFKKTYLDGAAMLNGDMPVVALTLRHSRIDNFWFALMHELEHVRKHLRADRIFIADNLDDKTRSSLEEEEADECARNALIPTLEWENANVRTTYLYDDAIELANKLQIHPAIVAGRVRFETKNWHLLNRLICSYKNIDFPDTLSQFNFDPKSSYSIDEVQTDLFK